MTIDHFGGPVARVTKEALGYVSALEGFVLLSGFMFATVYWCDTAEPKRLFSRVGRRMLRIYKYQTLLLLSLVILTLSARHRAALEGWIGPYLVAPHSYFALTLFTLHQPVYFDILPVYLGFLAISPFILIAFGRGWTVPTLFTSGLLWLAGQQFRPIPGAIAFFCAGCRLGPVHGLAWQSVWVAGLYLGFRQASMRPLSWSRNSFVVGLCMVTGALLLLARHGVVHLGFNVANAVDVAHLGWLRLLNFAVLVVLAGAVLRWLPRESNVPWLALLGRASLAVFSFHVGLIYLFLPFRPAISATGNVADGLVTLIVVASLTLPALASQKLRLIAASRGRPLIRPLLRHA